jgi:uncharacterized membrane protein YdbT with pleckstrin-like domain
LGWALEMCRCDANDTGVSNDEESTVWKDGPSQILNVPVFTAAFLMAIAFIVVGTNLHWSISLGAIVPAVIAGWKWLVVRCQKFEITTQRLRIFNGVLNQDIDEIELYRVKDTRILRPLWLRLFGLANLQLETSDRTHPKSTLAAIKGARDVREKLRRHVEILRDEKRVREVDFDETGDSEFGDELG